MHSRVRSASVLGILVAILAFPFTAVTETESGRRVFTNLQVLPEDITAGQLFDNMKQLTKALGVTCRTCHRNDIRDYASDEIEMKRIARQMMQMVDRMNEPLSDTTAEITCFTCHQGNRKPARETPAGGEP